MKKVLSFSMLLMVGLLLSQVLPTVMGESYATLSEVVYILLGTCLAFIMINVGREFELDKSNVGSYIKDYCVAMLAAAAPWILIAIYYVLFLLPSDLWSSGDAWKETLLLSRFAAPTSAGILFSMLAAIGLQRSWIYRKIQVLAIFDDLDTILLMIPLQIAMIGLHWQMGVILFVVIGLLWFGWKKMSSYSMRQDWWAILIYAVIVFGVIHAIYLVTKKLFGADDALHIEVLLPAFVLGMVIKREHKESKSDENITTAISLLFMLLVGMSMPQISASAHAVGDSIMASQPMPSWGVIALHVVVVSILSNIGKLVPMLFYRNHSIKERLALSIGMFTRGEVGAGVIFIALGYSIGGAALLISVLILVLNLVLTGVFVLIVKRLALSTYNE
ncbi:MAG: sodium:proton antiporter [Alistipes sp.]|nr:sodium:proton antiporter [Alistipes sp.]MBQ6584373.1 sodium:proton antiporter [Alistipes sp.]